MPMRYVAYVNVPGYMPMSDEPAVFENSADAWDYLADERKRDDNAWIPENSDDPDGPHRLDDTTLELERYARENHGIGTVYGNTPGCEPEECIHDLGLAYSVDYAEDDD